ncbi:hypothetical protein U1707_10065 [Sphingomonas sp. PB2P12]|uniref:hypothetical protein n=1 Tax=Sphingomonas sandaracina TaxID=3096157 RepID=UPI002FC5E465
MAAITEEALRGEWFYLEEEQPLDRSSPEFYILRDGGIRSSTKQDIAGTYALDGDQVTIAFRQRADTQFTITLRAPGEAVTPKTELLQADAIYRLAGEPVEYYGTFVRRSAS